MASDHDQSPATGLSFALAAGWTAPATARNKIREWLEAHEWPAAHVDDLVLSISEAVSNSVEHGYGVAVDGALPDPPGLIEVEGAIVQEPGGYRRVVLRIIDHGRWKKPDTGPTNRRQGLRIMRACTEEMTVAHTADGTTVVLRSWPIPMPLPQH
ncbi:ATP-binding protein [Kibdelosporangium aridum]|uniref:Anti-sigma regulatory factor (Ser/Thr protein kinase) n=1 Tax=Kibdelosporangium aridum TaxID=2030 RepID=A0A1W2BKV8_KIBAR|nr:ATP-binding protein [Kibdelosporangium aridum]SMC73476.1 Anti-sigma regulatory factor (Ser/Thr protein kinase) [Kibdelosporangium aridum]